MVFLVHDDYSDINLSMLIPLVLPNISSLWWSCMTGQSYNWWQYNKIWIHFTKLMFSLPPSQTGVDFIRMSVSSSLFKSSVVVLFRTLRCSVCFTFMEEGYEGGCLTRPNRELLYNWNSSLVGRRSASDTGLCKERRRGVRAERSGTTSRKREKRIVQFGIISVKKPPPWLIDSRSVRWIAVYKNGTRRGRAHFTRFSSGAPNQVVNQTWRKVTIVPPGNSRNRFHSRRLSLRRERRTGCHNGSVVRRIRGLVRRECSNWR